MQQHLLVTFVDYLGEINFLWQTNEHNRAVVRTGATGAIAPVDFELFIYLSDFLEEEKIQ